MKKREYLYALANEATGMDLVRSVWAKNIDEAQGMVARLAPCFGKSTQVIGVEEANAPRLKLQGGSNAKKDVMVRGPARKPRSVPDVVPRRQRASR